MQRETMVARTGTMPVRPAVGSGTGGAAGPAALSAEAGCPAGCGWRARAAAYDIQPGIPW